MGSEEVQIQVPRTLGLRLTDWHCSMYDPVYAVSSSSLANKAVPESVFRGALSNMEASIGDPGHAEHQQEIQEIVSAMKAVLGESEVRSTIINAMARYLWADSWDSALTDRGEGVGMGAELTHAAPPTPKEAVDHAKNLLEEFEELNNTTIEQVVEKEKPADLYDYGGVIAGNFLGFGIESMGDYKTPWCETTQLWDLVPEESES